MSVANKITDFLNTPENPYPTECFAVPGSDSIIDCVHPVTGKTVYYAKTLEDCQTEYPGAIRMTIERFCQEKAARQDTKVTWIETTAERFDAMLECLPPAYMGRGGFLVGEPYDHHAGTGRPRYQAFIQRSNGQCFQSSRPVTIQEFKKGEI